MQIKKDFARGLKTCKKWPIKMLEREWLHDADHGELSLYACNSAWWSVGVFSAPKVSAVADGLPEPFGTSQKWNHRDSQAWLLK